MLIVISKDNNVCLWVFSASLCRDSHQVAGIKCNIGYCIGHSVDGYAGGKAFCDGNNFTSTGNYMADSGHIATIDRALLPFGGNLLNVHQLAAFIDWHQQQGSWFNPFLISAHHYLAVYRPLTQ
ncbi:hypothetical protein D3C79_960800 [compost metagenome]